MPRTKDAAAPVTAAVADLVRSVTSLVDRLSAAVGDGASAVGAARRAGRAVAATATAKSAKLKSSLKSYWARLKGKEREERIRKMLAGRGLVPKAKGASRAKGGRGRGRRPRAA